MRHGQGGRLPIPTEAELAEAISLDREVVACSGKRFGSLIAVTVAFHNGDISTVSLDEHAALCLFAALKALFPAIESASASPARIRETESGVEVQCGHMSG
jgi:hypothetical protein